MSGPPYDPQQLRDWLWEDIVFPDDAPGRPDRTGRHSSALVMLQALKKIATEADDEKVRLVCVERALMIWQMLGAETMQWVFDCLSSKNAEDQSILRFWMHVQTATVGPITHRSALDPVALLLPRDLAEKLHEAMQALRSGEIRPIIEPAATERDHGAWSQDQMRMRAVEHVHFLHGQGVALGIARSRVGAHMKNVAKDTLRKWETDECPVNIFNCADRISTAAGAGRLQAKKLSGTPTPVVDGKESFMLEELTKRDPLAAFGERYHSTFGSRHMSVIKGGS